MMVYKDKGRCGRTVVRRARTCGVEETGVAYVEWLTENHRMMRLLEHPSSFGRHSIATVPAAKPDPPPKMKTMHSLCSVTTSPPMTVVAGTRGSHSSTERMRRAKLGV